MNIDAVSERIILIALYLNQKIPGTVSAMWIDNNQYAKLQPLLPHAEDIDGFIRETKTIIEQVIDVRRKEYLQGLLSSLDFQIHTLNSQSKYSDFSEAVFGYRIHRVLEYEIDAIEQNIKILESELKSGRFEIFERYTLDPSLYLKEIEKNFGEVKSLLPKVITDFHDTGVNVQPVTGKPWSAFNIHTAPYTSLLQVNIDMTYTTAELFRLACHEGYGGHHAELSIKDSLLLEEGRGEHGIVVLFSPQTFLSEALAEGMYILLNVIRKGGVIYKISWYYTRLIFALYNLVTFYYVDDGLSRGDIEVKLLNYGISEKTRIEILNSCTDPLFGKYAPVYYTAYNYMARLFWNTQKKYELIHDAFRMPYTPTMLSRDFGTT